MNPPFDPLPTRRPALYMLPKSHPFTCAGCGQQKVGESPSTKYCKSRECQQVKADRIAARAKRRYRR